MRIKEIQVEKLFDVFDYKIPLNERGITLLLGENGSGKTVILNMLKTLLTKGDKGHYFKYLEDISFNAFHVIFENDTEWILTKDSDSLILTEYSENRIIYEGRLVTWSEKKIEGYKTYRDNWNGKSMWYKLLSEAWYVEKTRSIKLIETERLHTTITEEDPFGDESYTRILSTKANAQKLAALMENTLAAATKIAGELDSSYLKRLSQKKKENHKIDEAWIKSQLDLLEEKRNLLCEAGLIEKEAFSQEFEPDFTDEFMKPVMQVYIQDMNEKLAVFEELAAKIQRLMKTVNKRFLHKKLAVDREKGFIFTSTLTEKEIPLNKLSSGEQHELVLFYELLFEIKAGSLVLMDEPEISLHISWQNEFVNDLQKVLELNKIDILIATHSPDIIDSHWDLTVQLNTQPVSIVS